MMLVIAIIAAVVTGAAIGIGAVTRSHLRSGAMKVASAASFAYSRSLTHGVTTRIRFDFEKNTMTVEESETPVALAAEDEFETEADAVDPWELARQRVEKPLEPATPTSGFFPITNDQGTVLKKYQPQPLGDGVIVHQLITPHEESGRTTGQGSIYFFPGGVTEHAVVQLSDKNDTVYSVELHALTGKAKIHSFAYEPVSLREEESEVRDPS